jgi:hypothetical protein
MASTDPLDPIKATLEAENCLNVIYEAKRQDPKLYICLRDRLLAHKALAGAGKTKGISYTSK